MKKGILFILFAVFFVVSSYTVSWAQTYVASSPFTYSFVQVIPNFDVYGDHAVLTYESTDNLGSFFLVLLDYTGTPVGDYTTYYYPYIFAGVRSDGGIDLYGSSSGFSGDWTLITTF
jgi:hypothetical protein